MAKNTSISLGPHFDQFIASQVHNGRFTGERWGKQQRNTYLKHEACFGFIEFEFDDEYKTYFFTQRPCEI